jgi:hypothetical protein
VWRHEQAHCNGQQITAGHGCHMTDKLKAVTSPPETVKLLTAGLPTYSPIPNPAVLVVTCTLVAEDIALSTTRSVKSGRCDLRV